MDSVGVIILQSASVPPRGCPSGDRSADAAPDSADGVMSGATASPQGSIDEHRNRAARVFGR